MSNRVESLEIRDWQRDLVASVWDADPMPRIAGWCLPRGQGKSTLCAAIAVWVLMTGGEAASVDVVAVDERQAQIIGQKCAMIVQRNPQLDQVRPGQCQPVPHRRGEFG
ncbi:hypothetical protein [Mycolicibacterium elephantis]|uniref:hypothetical protein n=1 Tax=Mycolicibacterium elephantis TaxID=81858 RepID=UPI001055174A|nr:hypothetical protein [Mycolicibacterium elephantis]